MMNQGSRHRWYESLHAEGEEPYDLGIFKELLKENAFGGDFDEMSLPLNLIIDDLDSNKTYSLISVKSHFFPDTAELAAINRFVDRGNTLFLSSKQISPLFALAISFGMDSLHNANKHINNDDLYSYVPDSVLEAYETVDWDKRDSVFQSYKSSLIHKIEQLDLFDTLYTSFSVTLKNKSTGNKIRLKHAIREDSIFKRWNKLHIPANLNYKSLANFSGGELAFAKIRKGNGQIIVGSVPMVFTNYNLLRKQNFYFCNDLLAELPQQTILFDEAKRFNLDAFTPKASLGKSPLSFILSQQALRWAWFTLLGTLLIFVIFRSRRKQRIIPILKPNVNTTLAYAKMLGSLQLKEKNNVAKGREIFLHFMQHLRSKNRWQSKEVNEELKNILIKLVPQMEKEIQLVMYMGHKVDKGSPISDLEVIRLFNYTQRILEKI